MRRMSSLIIIVMLGLLFAGCAATPEAPPMAAEPPSEPQEGGTLNVWQPNGWPEQSVPHRSNWETSWAISPMIERLFWPKPDGTMEPLLATGYDVSDDGLVYTLHLREGVKWHDGEPFTAEDVAYSLLLRLNPNLRPLNESRQGRTIIDQIAYNRGEADSITGMTVIDDHTIQFTLESPDAGLPRLFFGGDFPEIVPKHALEALDQDQLLNGTAEYWYTNPIGTGPYKFIKYETDQYIEFERFDDYWGGKPGPEKLFLKIASPEVAIVLLQKGEVDFVNPLQLTEVNRLQADTSVDILVAENNAQWYGMEINSFTQDGFWRNPKAKQALLYAIDRQAYVDSILQGFGTVRHSFYDGTAYACPTMTKYDYDPDKAKAMFEEIGVPEDMVIDLMSWLGIKARLDYLPIAQEYLRKIGFKVNVDLIDNSLIVDYIQGEGPRGKDWDFHVLLFGPGVDPGGILPFMDPESTSNWGYRSWPEVPDSETGRKPNAYIYDNPRVNELITQARVETDAQKRVEIYQEIDCIWNEELPAFMTASPSFVAAKSVRLQGVDWQTNAALGNWTTMYKIGDWWLWQQ